MIHYYREYESGDYLAIDTDTNSYYRQNLNKDYFEGRATAIARQIDSVCTTGIAREYLQEKCERIAKKDVPVAWLNAIGEEDS